MEIGEFIVNPCIANDTDLAGIIFFISILVLT